MSRDYGNDYVRADLRTIHKLEARIEALERVVEAARAFREQAARGESENPERYSATYLALDAALRSLDELGGTE